MIIFSIAGKIYWLYIGVRENGTLVTYSNILIMITLMKIIRCYPAARSTALSRGVANHSQGSNQSQIPQVQPISAHQSVYYFKPFLNLVTLNFARVLPLSPLQNLSDRSSTGQYHNFSKVEPLPTHPVSSYSHFPRE